MAYRAGARVGNLEFVQFHPTMFHDPGGAAFLISEAVRGYGGVLVNHRGERFVDARHPLGSLATRDVVARAIVDELRQSGRQCAYLDVTGKEPEATRRRFPNIFRHCLSAGIDMTREPIPVVPAAHYMCGGVVTDLQGRTDIDGLYAAGEVAMTGFHGANRLASNSLLEAVVLAGRAYAHSSEQDRPPAAAWTAWEEGGADRAAEEELAALRSRLRRCTWEKVGIIRDDCGLETACRELDEVRDDIEALYKRHTLGSELAELRNMATVAALVAHSARLRKESRGGHFNGDHPRRDDSLWQAPTLLRKPWFTDRAQSTK
jgi:L-aspartate oxidase